jgi:hypothetical protein
MSAHVAYDTKTGRIIAVHHGQVNKEHARQLAANYAKIRQHTKSKGEKIGEGQIAVISVALEDFNPTKQYKVDAERKTLVETDKGIALSMSTARTPRK